MHLLLILFCEIQTVVESLFDVCSNDLFFEPEKFLKKNENAQLRK